MKSASTGSPAGSPPMRFPEMSSRHSAGFTLLETLIALTILAIALVSLFQAQSTGLRTVDAADNYGKARILAHALLANAMSGAGKPPRPADGREGAFVWSVSVSLASGDLAEIQSKRNWRLHHIRVLVTWDRNRRIELESLKLASPTGQT
jgi:prepilin-type N-terminal cleavage/methylation domain-containing protein